VLGSLFVAVLALKTRARLRAGVDSPQTPPSPPRPITIDQRLPPVFFPTFDFGKRPPASPFTPIHLGLALPSVGVGTGDSGDKTALTLGKTACVATVAMSPGSKALCPPKRERPLSEHRQPMGFSLGYDLSLSVIPLGIHFHSKSFPKSQWFGLET
jgi:hypothetical protein